MHLSKGFIHYDINHPFESAFDRAVNRVRGVFLGDIFIEINGCSAALDDIVNSFFELSSSIV